MKINTSESSWIALSGIYEREIASCREQLESPQCDPREADVLRGHIERMKMTLALAEKPRGELVNPDPFV